MYKIKKIIFLIVIILILNTIWEFSHYFLYIDLSGIEKNTHLIIATFADLFIILTIFLLVSVKNKNIKWLDNPNRYDYLWIFLMTISTASLIEIINLNLGRWQYTHVMPTIFGIGLSPLLQLVTTSILSLQIINIKKNET